MQVWLLGLLLLGFAAALAAIFARRVPAFRQVSKLRAALGILFFYGLAALPIGFSVRALATGSILLGLRRSPDIEFSVLATPFGFWATYVLYLVFCTFFMAFAFYYTGHALRIWRGRA